MSERARDAELTAKDAAARRLAQVEFERPLLVEAGAGTGKTAALVARVLAWCLGPGWERAEGGGGDRDRVAARVLSGVVAITFTEAAAAEMAQRIGGALLEVERGARPTGLLPEVLEASRVAERARALRGALDHLFVDTIHAWCRRLLVTHPLEAGLHPHLEVDADERIQRAVVREVLEARLREAYASDPSLLALSAAEVDPPRIEEELLELLRDGLPARDLEADPWVPERIAALCGRLRESVEAVLEAGAGLRDVNAPVARETFASLERTASRIQSEPPRDAAELPEFLGWFREEWPDNRRGRLHRWARLDYGKGEAEALGGDAERLAEAARPLALLVPHVCVLDPDLLTTARVVLCPLLAEIEGRLRTRGVATFAALLGGARDLLATRPSVAARVRERIDQLLVDEFQDTDRRQCDILRTVAFSGPPASRPGLFLVGDPKQSIYGWRSADLSAYEGFARDVEEAGGGRPRLSVNHRSVPPLLDEVERIVEPVMQYREGLQPRFQPLAPCPRLAEESGFRAGRCAPTEYWVPRTWNPETGESEAPRAREAARLEARALARDLRELHDAHGVAWKECGVLFRSRGDWEIYLDALRAGGVPYAAEGDRNYYQRREVIDAAAFVRCLLDPNDHLALLAALRSTAVGVPDAALVPLWTRGFPALLGALHAGDAERRAVLREVVEETVRCFPEDIPGIDRVAGWEQNLLHAIDAIAILRRSFAEDPGDVFVEKLRTAFLLEASESARHLGAWRVANLDRFFRDLEAALSSGEDVRAVLRRLRGAVLEEIEAEEGRPREIFEDAVQVMTIHGAKGLDFEHVYLMQLHKGARRTALDGVQSAEKDGWSEYRLLGAPTPGWDRVEGDRREVEAAERARTLYVAMTRAKRRFVLAGLWDSGSDNIAELIRHRDRPDFEVTMRELAAEGGRDFTDARGARWVFPALSPEGLAEGGETPAISLPEPDAVAVSAGALREKRERARARMARSFGIAASAEAHAELTEALSEPARWRREGGGEASRAVGTAIHRALEDFDFGAGSDAWIEEEWRRARRALDASLGHLVPEEQLERARSDAASLAGQVAGGDLFARLRALAPRIVARELPVLLPPPPDAVGAAYVSGAIDLVYRDDESGELVVADYKTDREERQEYAAQGAVYREALRRALDLPYTPRFELWYLRLDRIV